MDREPNGKWAKGQSGNPKGRAPRNVERDYLTAMARRVSIEDWEAIVDKAISQARKGDYQARRWMSDYLMGTPIQRNEITGNSGGAIEIVVRHVRD